MESVKGLENTKYKLIKNEDKLVLTDKKTLKSRVLDVEDIDYVVDDNQKLRDANVIENYFRLKDEPYEQKMMTKTADYVKEQKEAEKYGVKNYTDIIENFIKKYDFTNNELHALAAIPDETSIRKFNNRGDAEKRAIINDFKVLKKELSEDKKITDTFTYLKAYFKNYRESHLDSSTKKTNKLLINYLKDPKHYSAEDYDKIKDNDIQNLDDMLKLEVEKFDNIDLNLLNNWVIRITEIFQIAELENINKYLQIKYYPPMTNKQNEIDLFVDKLTILPNPIKIQIYKQDIKQTTTGKKKETKTINPIETMPFVLSISNKILDKLIKDKVNKYMLDFDLKKFIKKIVDKGVAYFNTQLKIQKIKDIINNRPDDKDKYDFTGTIYIRTISLPINFSMKRLIIKSGENKILNIGTWIPEYKELSTQGTHIFNQIINIFQIIQKKSNDVGKGNMSASGWTDDTLSRIDNILSILNNYSSGMINPEHLKVCHMVGNVASGWTDDTLSRIDNILSTLNNYSSGMINPMLLKVMNRQKGFGWTDNTLSRIENINNTLSQYI